MAEPLTTLDYNKLIAAALDWQRVEEFMSHEMLESGYIVETGMRLSGYPPGEENEINVAPDWAGDANAALSLLQESKTGGFVLRFNPMINLYTCTILATTGAKLADEYGKTAEIAICCAWLVWTEAQP